MGALCQLQASSPIPSRTHQACSIVTGRAKGYDPYLQFCDVYLNLYKGSQLQSAFKMLTPKLTLGQDKILNSHLKQVL